MKIWPLKGRGLGHVTNVEILGPLYIFGMTKARDFIFGAYIDYDMYYPMHNKLAHKVGVFRVTWPKFKIWDPSITFEWIKPRIPNFVF